MRLVAPGTQGVGDLFEGDSACGYTNNKVIRLIVRYLKISPIESIEDDDGEPSQTFVAVDKSVVTHYRLKECCGLRIK